MCRFDHSVFYDRCSIRATSLCHRSDHADPEWNERNRHMDLGQGRIPVPYNKICEVKMPDCRKVDELTAENSNLLQNQG